VKQETLLGQPALDRQSIETLWLNLDPQTADPEPRIDSTGPPAAPEELWLALKELQQQNRELTEKYRKADGAHRHYRRLFEHAPDGFLATDLAGTIQQANHAAASLLRLPERELTGKSLILFVSGRDRKRLESHLSKLQSLPACRDGELQIQMQPARGKPFDAAMMVQPIPSLEPSRIDLLWTLRDITRLKRVAERLRVHRNQLRILSARCLHAREEEAKRIAHLLHDEAGQITAAGHLALEEIGRQLPASGRDRLKQLKTLLGEVEERLRQLSHELRPTVLDDLGLDPAIEFLAAGFSARARVPIAIKGSTGGRLDPLIETAMYRIVHEALTNAIRHARARRVRIQIRRGRGRLCCSIRDDGVGFDCDRLLSGPGRKGGLGLLGIRERLDALGGRLQIRSSPGHGTELQVAVPLRRRQ